jgi:signal peptidase I
MGSNLVWVWSVLAVAGVLLILFSGKDADGKAASTEWGYLALLGGCFGLLSGYMTFSAVMLIIVLVTGAIWALDKFMLARRRAPGAAVPHYIDFPRGFFPIIAVVFLLRSFVAEPFQIPSSSMRPGLIVGDFILVNKFAYGLRVPVLNNVLVPVGKVEHGDVVVFNYPEDEKVNFIKRVIGLPGDVVSYKGKQLSINGKTVEQKEDGTLDYVNDDLRLLSNNQFVEKLGGKTFRTLQLPFQPVYEPNQVRNFRGRENCEYVEDGFTCKVPEGNYFMMGDNRDNSGDSRYWGFVEDRLLVGKAFLIWMNFGDLSRIGTRIH